MQLPQAFLQSLQQVEGFDEAAFTAVHQSGEQVTSIRINPRKAARGNAKEMMQQYGWQMKPVPWCSDGFYLAERPSFTLDPLLHAGAYYVQEASSMFLQHVLNQVCDKKDALVLDLCAAPGGKSTLLSSFFTDGLVVSNEVIKSRVNTLQENLVKWGNGNIVITNNDSKDFGSLPQMFDVVVTDVPCSGSGLFRRDPAAVAEWSPQNVNLCCQRQQRILADVLPALKNNGILIYSTCSYSAEEDEDIMDWLVNDGGLQPLVVEVPASWQIVTTKSHQHAAVGYRFFPDKLKGEGFFLAVFRKPGNSENIRYKQGSLSLPTAAEKARLLDYLPQDDSRAMFRQAETMYIFPAQFMDTLKVLAAGLYIRYAGIAAGSFKGKSFVPHHALALSEIKTAFPDAVVTKPVALDYLRKNDLPPLGEEGWCRVTHAGLGLGWIKNLPNRTNNYYPAEWRILMR